MISLLAAQLMLIVSHDAAARAELRPLERYAYRMELVVSLAQDSRGDLSRPGNAIADSALEELMRWPSLVAVELIPPLTSEEASALRKLKRIGVRLPPRSVEAHASQTNEANAVREGAKKNESRFILLQRAREEAPSLALLGPALIRVERAAANTVAPGPCPGTEESVRSDGASEIRVDGEISRCLVEWLERKLEPHREPLGDPFVGAPHKSLPTAPGAAPRR